MKDNTVIVIDASNYKASYAEPVPFKAIVTDKYDHGLLTICVTSIETGKEYELYSNQVLEALHIKEIANLLDMTKYGQQPQND